MGMCIVNTYLKLRSGFDWRIVQSGTCSTCRKWWTLRTREYHSGDISSTSAVAGKLTLEYPVKGTLPGCRHQRRAEGQFPCCIQQQRLSWISFLDLIPTIATIQGVSINRSTVVVRYLGNRLNHWRHAILHLAWRNPSPWQSRTDRESPRWSSRHADSFPKIQN